MGPVRSAPAPAGAYTIFTSTDVPDPLPPTVVSFSPSSGSDAGGTVVTITGTALAGATSVTIGGVTARIISNTDTQIGVITPSGTGSGRVSVTTTAGVHDGALPPYFRFETIINPKGINVTPAAGPTSGGTVVKLIGVPTDVAAFLGPEYNIFPPERVTFGNEHGTADATVVSYDIECFEFNEPGGSPAPCATGNGTYRVQYPVVTVIAPPSPLPCAAPCSGLAGGIVDVVLYTPFGKSAPVRNTEFHYGSPPVLTGVSPSTVPIGALSLSLTATGTNFVPGAQVLAVSPDGTVHQAAANVTSATSLSATIDFPQGIGAGTLTITVVNPAPNYAVSSSWPVLTTVGAVAATSVSGYSSVGLPNTIQVSGTGGTGVLAVAQYAGNPSGTAKGLLNVGGTFLDVYVSPDATYAVVTVTICDPNSADIPKFFDIATGLWTAITPVYWTGGTACPNGQFVFTASESSTPSLSQLSGTYFYLDTLPVDGAPLTIAGVPSTQTLEATGPAGVSFTFGPVTAVSSDSVDVPVACDPDLGVFPLGSTVVTCTATNADGYRATAAFAVTVVDTTAPDLTVPADITASATGTDGAAISFASSAVDIVDGTVATVCLAPGRPVESGEVFPIGATTVTCGAVDVHGNTASAAFTVTVDDVTTPGEMKGAGFVRDGADKYDFAFDVREQESRGERGKFSLDVKYGQPPSTGDGGDDSAKKSGKKSAKKSGKSASKSAKGGSPNAGKRDDDRFRSTALTFVAFSDDPTIRPGRSRKVQIDSVRFSGIGEWNGETGYTFEVVATDQGEGRLHSESVAIVIRAASGQVVAEVSGELDGGNVQSKRIKH
jgi:hypothetical protein